MDRRGASEAVGGSGTYALMLRARRAGSVRIGSRGRLHVEPGAYLYVGSALGPGGLRARLARHAARTKPLRWHIDHLRPHLSLAGAWTSSRHLEHVWAARALALADARVPLARFGASDCRCASHLVQLPDDAAVRRAVGRALAATDARLRWIDAPALRALARCRVR